MNRFKISAGAGRAVAGLAVAIALAGCGTGQVAQTTDQESAVNGGKGTAGHVALRDVRIQAVQDGDSLPAGSTVDLVFVATNQSTDADDELTKISTDIGKVSVAGGKELPAGGLLIASAPTGPDATSAAALKELRGTEAADTATATLTLDKPISNGLTYGFTFDFKEAGPISLNVPISAEATTRR